jgi:hypothetical protein
MTPTSRPRRSSDLNYGGGVPLAVLRWELRLIRRLLHKVFNRDGDAQDWERLLTRWKAYPDADLVRVLKVYQLARTGTKAIIRFESSGKRRDAWFDNRRVRPGDYLLITGRDSAGHHHRSLCRYVHPEHLHASATPRARRRYVKAHPTG